MFESDNYKSLEEIHKKNKYGTPEQNLINKEFTFEFVASSAIEKADIIQIYPWGFRLERKEDNFIYWVPFTSIKIFY